VAQKTVFPDGKAVSGRQRKNVRVEVESNHGRVYKR
jgi:hypothetical protein